MLNFHFNGTCKEELERKCEKKNLSLEPMREVLLALGTCYSGPKIKSVTSSLQLASKDVHQEKALN